MSGHCAVCGNTICVCNYEYKNAKAVNNLKILTRIATLIIASIFIFAYVTLDIKNGIW